MRLLEQAYFHTGNSGITVEVQKDKNEYFLTITHGAHGHRSQFRTPILDETQAEVMAGIFARTTTAMIEDREAGTLQESPVAGSRRRPDGVRNGVRYDPEYREYVLDQYSTQTVLIGYQVTDATTNKFIRYDLFWDDWIVSMGEGSCETGEPPYTKEQVGKRLIRNSVYKKIGDKYKITTEETFWKDFHRIQTLVLNDPKKLLPEYENVHAISVKENRPDSYSDTSYHTEKPNLRTGRAKDTLE